MLETGVPNLDLVLGGGIVEGDVMLVIGAPGSGKTTFAVQLAFHAASTGRPVVILSTFAEPGARLLKRVAARGGRDRIQFSRIAEGRCGP